MGDTPDHIRRKIDPRYNLRRAIEEYDAIRKRHWLGNLSEQAAVNWIEHMDAQTRLINSIYEKHPWLLFERDGHLTPGAPTYRPTDDPCDETPVIRDGVNWFLPPETKFWTTQPKPYRK